MIEIKQLTKTYPGGVQAIRGMDLEINGGMFGLLGPNGAGKTTLMRLLAGLLTPTSGSLRVLGEDVRTQSGRQAVRMALGYLPQSFSVYPELTAAEFLDYVAVLKRIRDRAARRRQIDSLLEQMHLTEAAGRRLKGFSGGMIRRVGIAQALLGEPQLLIVDEPTAGLDPEERVRVRNILGEMSRRCTVLLSTHIVEDISQSCSDLAVINAGQVLFHAAPRELIGCAAGKVWQVVTEAALPEGGPTVVSTIQLQEGTRYRLVGDLPAGVEGQAVEPTLEDGYIWLMREAKR